MGDHCDRCPAYRNPGQADADGDLIGDVCDFVRYEDCLFSEEGPSDRWQAGTYDGTTFTPFAYSSQTAPLGILSWHTVPNPLTFPRASRCNSVVADCTYANLVLPRNAMVLHPSNTRDAMVRVGMGVGTTDLDVTFRSAATRGNPVSANVEVLFNGAVVYTGTVDGFVNSPPGTARFVGQLESWDPHSVIEFRVRSRGTTAQHDGVIVDIAGSCAP